MKAVHQSKKVETKLGFGTWENNKQNTIDPMKHCDLCDYVSKHATNLKRHMEVIHFNPKEKAKKLEKCNECAHS